MSRFLVVALGGAFGAMARYGVWKRDFLEARLPLDPFWRLLVATGLVGAYTTFSTFEYETQRLTESGAFWWGALNVITSVAAGFAAVQLGVSLARR